MRSQSYFTAKKLKIMKTEWLKRGPSLGELVAEVKDNRRKKRSRLTLIIPTFRDNELLEKHITKLANQTFQDFDVIIVYGEEDRFIETPKWASILHIREKGRNGCAGAFYLGGNLCI